MADLAMAIPEMMSGAPENAAGADDGIVTEKTFVKFSTEYLRLNKKIIDNKQRVERVRERIDMMMARRNRRVGAPEKAVEDEEKEEEEKSNIFGDILKKLLDLAKSLIKSFIFFAKKLLTGLLKFLGKIFLLKKMMPIIKKVFNGLLGKKLKLFKALGLGAVFGGLLALFSGSGSEAKEEVPPDFVGDGDDTEAPVVAVEEEEVFVDLEEADFTDDDTIAPPVEPPPPPKPAAAPPPPPATPAPPSAPAQAAPASSPPAPTAASAPPPAAAPAAKPAPKPKAEEQGKPEKIASPEERAKKEFGALDKGQALANQVGEIDDELEKLNEQADKIENDDDPKKVALMKRIEELENKRDNVSKQQDSLNKPDKFDKVVGEKTKGDRAFDEDAKGKPDRVDKALDDDGEIKKTKIPVGAPTKVTQTTTKESEETTTGGGSTTRQAAKYADTERTKKLRKERKKVHRERISLIKQLRAQGADFNSLRNNPKIKELYARYDDLRRQIKESRVLVSAASVTRTPGKNIRKTSTKVIVKPVVVKTETRVRQ